MTITSSVILLTMGGRPLGIAELRGRIPFLLAQLGAHVSDDFQHRLGIHHNAMVTVIDNLERRGLAKRLPHPHDRRAVAVTRTDNARHLLPDLDEQGRALEDKTSTPLSHHERDTLRALLQRVAAGAGLIPGVHPQLA